MQGVEDGEVGFAWNAKDVIHALRDKLIDQNLTAGSGFGRRVHARILFCEKTVANSQIVACVTNLVLR